MLKAVNELKKQKNITKFLNITFLLRLAHNCAEKGKEFYPDVNYFITACKWLTNKNKKISDLFGFGKHPSV